MAPPNPGKTVNAREEILTRIRAASVASNIDSVIARDYRGPAGRGSADLFAERLVDYRALVVRLDEGALAQHISESLERRGARRVVVPEGFPEQWLERITATRETDAPEMSTAQLDQLDGVITLCSVAIAETGTIVLTHGIGQGRRALSLVPDYHLVVVYESQVLNGVPDAVAAVDSSSPVTWISGPSATSDIELIRVEGVHGPRTLEVLLVSDR
jgi:L-lactate dehydrogenase complex protein LldG